MEAVPTIVERLVVDILSVKIRLKIATLETFLMAVDRCQLFSVVRLSYECEVEVFVQSRSLVLTSGVLFEHQIFGVAHPLLALLVGHEDVTALDDT